MMPLAGLLIAYLAGSIPFAYLAGKLFKGIDLREHGSGNLGATNVFRVMGWKIASVVMLLDIAKGALPVLLLPPRFAPSQPVLWAIAFGVAAIFGHVKSVFLLWKGGGKGVATAGGVFLALAPIPSVISLSVWATVLYLTGYVSLASLTSEVTLTVAVAIMYGVTSPITIASAVTTLFVFWTHRSNIGRLRRGEENRFRRARPAT
ncbi:MAG TPA: glycerol-3-phosphate 1-O-acyltransferase PlsY [Gemmatimonadaceae bacterium]|jgi:glycerol-3-phosphate acyltransferase PlsY|nr:glycerol-3-phosphate 1-O-acyltransferase PlsY [Gemmatimonadaceae bacterium]